MGITLRDKKSNGARPLPSGPRVAPIRRTHVQRSRPRRRSRWVGKVLPPRRMKYVFAASIALLVSLFVSGVIPNFFIYSEDVDMKMRAQMNIYQPRDIERHLLTIDRIMRDLSK